MRITVRDEIRQARLALKLTESQMRLLPEEEGLAVFQAAEATFVASIDRRWWWEDFKMPSVSLHFPNGQGWQRLTELVPSADAPLWFIAEDDRASSPSVYEASVSVVQQVLAQCSPFEYYLTPKGFDWLLGENHADVLFAVGEPVATNLSKLAEQYMA